MRFWARIVVSAYVLAIIVASLAPHCVAMFQAPAHTQVSVEDCEHADTGERDAGQSSEGECASMAMAKSVGPIPGTQVDLAPVSVSVVPAPVLSDSSPATLQAEFVRLRGPPPPLSDGFASIFASNHRLLI